MTTEASSYSDKAQEGDPVSAIKSDIMRLSLSITDQETGAKHLCIKLDNIIKELHHLFTSYNFSLLDSDSKEYAHSLWVRSNKLDECIGKLVDALSSVDQKVRDIPQGFVIPPLEQIGGTSEEGDTEKSTETEESSDEISPQASEQLPETNYHSKQIFTILPPGKGMREVWHSTGFLESFFKACEEAPVNFRTLVFTNIMYHLNNTYVSDPSLGKGMLGIYTNVMVKDYLISFASSFHGSPQKLSLAKLTLLKLYSDRKKGKKLVLPVSKKPKKIEVKPIKAPTRVEWLFPQQVKQLFEEERKTVSEPELSKLLLGGKDEVNAMLFYVKKHVADHIVLSFFLKKLRLNTTNDKIYKTIYKVFIGKGEDSSGKIKDRTLEEIITLKGAEGVKELFLHIIDGGRLSAYIESRIKSEKTVTRRGPKKKLDPVALKEPRKHEQPALIKANLMQDPPKSDILSLTYLDADNLQGSYQDKYHTKFYEFFQNKLRTVGSTYNTSINSSIDEFMELFYRLYQELVYLADQKKIYRSEVNSFENGFLLLLKKKGRTYEEVRSELIRYDYSRFKFRVTSCFTRR